MRCIMSVFPAGTDDHSYGYINIDARLSDRRQQCTEASPAQNVPYGSKQCVFNRGKSAFYVLLFTPGGDNHLEPNIRNYTKIRTYSLVTLAIRTDTDGGICNCHRRENSGET